MPIYSLPELANLAGVTPRTVRFYISQGLLPAPALEGPHTRYTDEHLARLRAIKKLQAAHLPLAKIRRELGAFQMDRLVSVAAAPAPSAGAAIDYIRDVLEAPSTLDRAATAAPPPPAMAATSEPTPQPEPLQTRSQWERISLDPDIELHIRRPLTRQSNKRVERLIAVARELFEED